MHINALQNSPNVDFVINARKGNMDKYINVDTLVVIVLGIALILAILFNFDELATNIALGLIGYIGGSAGSRVGGNNKWH